MPKRQATFDYLGIVNCNNKPVSIVPDIEYDESIYFIRVWKALTQLYKILPSCQFYDPDPGAEFSCGLTEFFRRL